MRTPGDRKAARTIVGGASLRGRSAHSALDWGRHPPRTLGSLGAGLGAPPTAPRDAWPRLAAGDDERRLTIGYRSAPPAAPTSADRERGSGRTPGRVGGQEQRETTDTAR